MDVYGERIAMSGDVEELLQMIRETLAYRDGADAGDAEVAASPCDTCPFRSLCFADEDLGGVAPVDAAPRGVLMIATLGRVPGVAEPSGDSPFFRIFGT